MNGETKDATQDSVYHVGGMKQERQNQRPRASPHDSLQLPALAATPSSNGIGQQRSRLTQPPHPREAPIPPKREQHTTPKRKMAPLKNRPRSSGFLRGTACLVWD